LPAAGDQDLFGDGLWQGHDKAFAVDAGDLAAIFADQDALAVIMLSCT
jgi:hypothetical protein